MSRSAWKVWVMSIETVTSRIETSGAKVITSTAGGSVLSIAEPGVLQRV